MRCRSCRTIVCSAPEPGSIRRETGSIFRSSATIRSAADWPRESFVARAHAIIRRRLRQSRLRSRCDTFSSVSGVYRCSYPMQSPRTKIDISIGDQLLTVKRDDEVVRTFPISSSRFGLGAEEGSNKTPLGRFAIAEKIGHGMPRGTVFKSRVPLRPEDPLPLTEDLITSRILWLD